MFSFTKKENPLEEQPLIVDLSEEELTQIVGGSNNWRWHHHHHHHYHYSHGHWEWEKIWKPVWRPIWEHVWESDCY